MIRMTLDCVRPSPTSVIQTIYCSVGLKCFFTIIIIITLNAGLLWLVVQTLYNYVFVHEASPDDFQIVTNFPRRVLPCRLTGEDPVAHHHEGVPTFAEFGLGRSETLFVHDNEA